MESVPLRMKQATIIDGLNICAVSREQLERTIKGGVNAINLTALPLFENFEETLLELSRTLKVIRQLEDLATVATSVADIYSAKNNGKLAIILGAQNSAFIGENVDHLEALWRCGLRIMQPTHNDQNNLGCGAPFLDDEDQGVTEMGYDWLQEMNRLGILVDLSHCGHRTTDCFLAAATGPLIFSHANAYEKWHSPRNKTNAQIRRVADLGGVVGAVMYAPALRGDRQPDLDDYLDHLDFMVNVAGVDHVGTSTDISEGHTIDLEAWEREWGPDSAPAITRLVGDWYTATTEFISDFLTLADMPRIWERLIARGYSEDAAEKLMGGNFVRVYENVWGR